MKQVTKFLGLDIGGVTDEPGLSYNQVTNMNKIDHAIEQASQQGVDTLRRTVEALQADVLAIQQALAKTGDPLTVEGLSNGVLTAGGYVAVADPEPVSET